VNFTVLLLLISPQFRTRVWRGLDSSL